MVCSDNYDDFQKKIPRKSKFLSRQLKREEEAKREEKERNRAREESGVRERESRSKMEGAGKGGKEGVDVRCLSLEELEAMNRDLEERAASSVAAAEQALRSVQLKEEDIQQNAEKLVQLVARKATQPDSHGKENRSERLESSQKRIQQARPASARHKPTQQLANKSHATPDSKSTKESEAGPVKFTRPSSSSSSRPSSSVPRSSEKQKSQQESPQMHSSFPSDFDLPSRPDAQVRLYKARIKALEADLYAQEVRRGQSVSKHRN